MHKFIIAVVAVLAMGAFSVAWAEGNGEHNTSNSDANNGWGNGADTAPAESATSPSGAFTGANNGSGTPASGVKANVAVGPSKACCFAR